MTVNRIAYPLDATVFTPEGMEPDTKAVEQLFTCLAGDRFAVKGALMADHHLGYSMPIGGVIAYDGAISPSGVGFDIACGNKAVKTSIKLEDLSPGGVSLEKLHTAVKPVMREIQKKVAFGMGRRNQHPVDHALFESDLWPEIEDIAPGLKQKAAAQLGTVGSGNHYVDLLLDREGFLWIANHFGSRGFGHTIASAFLNLAAGLDPSEKAKDKDEPTVIDLNTNLGAFYMACMNLAGEYAYAGRDYVIEQVLGILGNPEVTFSVHNHHNFAWEEDGLIVVRKGATPLTDQPAFIGGSMGDVSVIVRGTGEDLGNIGSAPHGAGRVMSRTKAAGKMKRGRDAVTGKRYRYRDTSTAAVDWDATRASLTERGIVVLGAGADEAPQVYKSLANVIAAHENIEVLETLAPIGVVMAGPDEFDPYKD